MSGKCYLWINLSIPKWVIFTSNDMRKYPTVTDVLKMAVSLPHGNADVEKRLSVNNSIITNSTSVNYESKIL